MDPQVIHLIICDRVFEDPNNLLRLNVSGLRVRLRSRNPLPIKVDIHALVMMVGYRGSDEVWFRIIEEATQMRVAQSPRRRVRFPQDPEEVYSFSSRVTGCTLPRYGRYRLELCLGDEVIAQRPFWLSRRI